MNANDISAAGWVLIVSIPVVMLVLRWLFMLFDLDRWG
jgi:hypothetical protein